MFRCYTTFDSEELTGSYFAADMLTFFRIYCWLTLDLRTRKSLKRWFSLWNLTVWFSWSYRSLLSCLSPCDWKHLKHRVRRAVVSGTPVVFSSCLAVIKWACLLDVYGGSHIELSWTHVCFCFDGYLSQPSVYGCEMASLRNPAVTLSQDASTFYLSVSASVWAEQCKG